MRFLSRRRQTHSPERPALLRVLPLVIGAWVAGPQWLPGQQGSGLGTGGPGALSERDGGPLATSFRRFLLEVPTRDLVAGWQLALDVGRPAATLLWEMLRRETSDVGQRLRLLAAAMLAGGMLEDETLFAWLGQQKPMLEERTLAALLLACGPQRKHAQPQFWNRMLGGEKSAEQILAIAVRLAAVRFPEGPASLPVLASDDPGLCAATAFAGQPLPASIAAKWWNLPARPEYAELVWRGALLGGARAAAGGVEQGLLLRAHDVLQIGGEPYVQARAAAVWLRAAAHAFDDKAALDIVALQIAVGDVHTATTLHTSIEPIGHLRAPEPHRLAVAYALSRPPQVVVEQRQQWGTDPKFAAHVALALAFQLAGRAQPEPVTATLPAVPEWQLVRAASGAPVEVGVPLADPVLAEMLRLFAEGRLPRPALRVALEEALWRHDGHPHLVPWELERLLVRDLLLSGSDPGTKYHRYLRAEKRYAPTGMGRDEEFFRIAVALFDFLVKVRAPLPAEHRLP